MTEDQLERWMRGITASLMADEFLLRFLMTQALVQFPQDQRETLLEHLRTMSRNADAFEGRAKDDEFLAEVLSDVLVQTYERLDRMLDQVLEQFRQMEARKLSQRSAD